MTLFHNDILCDGLPSSDGHGADLLILVSQASGLGATPSPRPEFLIARACLPPLDLKTVGVQPLA